MLKKSLIGLVVIALIGGGGYFWYQNYQQEQKRLRKEASELLYKTIARASVEAQSAIEREVQELAERRKRIEAGTAKIKHVEEVMAHGDKCQYTLVDGKKEGPSFIWYKNGRKSAELNYKDGRKTFYISFYDKEGSPKQSETKNGPNQKEEAYGWYKNGMLEYQSYTSEENDRKLNWGKSWYEDGSIRSETKYNPETEFVDKSEWYPSGQIKQIRSEGRDSKNISIEIYKGWYENGQQKIEETKRFRTPDGRVYEWDENGNLITNELWVNGNIDREQTDPKMIRSRYQLKK